MAVPEILAGILLVALVVKFKRKTPIYYVLVILGAYGVFKYFNRFEHLTGEAKTKRLAEIEKDITYLKSVGLTETSDNETMKKLVAERNSLNAPAPPPAAPVAVSAPAPAKVPEKPIPWSLCSIEKRGVL